MKQAKLVAGIPAANATLYWIIRFSVPDPAALIELPNESGGMERLLIIRDIEMDRARKNAKVDKVACPADFVPEGGLSGERETATAQSVAECLKRNGIQLVIADRTLPLIYAEIIRKAGITVECDFDLGISGRRSKDAQEIAWMREAQGLTEKAVRLGCEMVANAEARENGLLYHSGKPLTVEIVRNAINICLLENACIPAHWIVAPGKQGADCHEHGSGEIHTGEPVIIDVYPVAASKYCGDCTRTVVHGEISEQLRKMHTVVLEAKHAAAKILKAGITGEDVHKVTVETMKKNGYEYGLPSENSPDSFISLPHGTGHGLGLAVHEPPLLDFGGPELVCGDVVTIEPGLYGKSVGGIRVEDVYVVSENGNENIGTLPEGLEWK